MQRKDDKDTPKRGGPRSPRSRNLFNRREIARGCRAIVDAGMRVARVEIDPITGRIAIVTKHGDEAEPGDAHNSWDDTVTSNATDPKRTA